MTGVVEKVSKLGGRSGLFLGFIAIGVLGSRENRRSRIARARGRHVRAQRSVLDGAESLLVMTLTSFQLIPEIGLGIRSQPSWFEADNNGRDSTDSGPFDCGSSMLDSPGYHMVRLVDT